MTGINCKTIALVFIFCAALFFVSTDYCEGADAKEDMVAYIKEISSIVTNVDITIRSVGFNTLSIKEGVRRMNVYIGQAKLTKYPKVLSRQYTMILLAFEKLRAGLSLLSLEKKDTAIRVIKSGTQLLKYAAKDILAVADKEGIRKSNKPAEKESYANE